MEKKKLIIFTDSGDTLIDEGSEIRKVKDGVVYLSSVYSRSKGNFAGVKRTRISDSAGGRWIERIF